MHMPSTVISTPRRSIQGVAVIGHEAGEYHGEQPGEHHGGHGDGQRELAPLSHNVKQALVRGVAPARKRHVFPQVPEELGIEQRGGRPRRNRGRQLAAVSRTGRDPRPQGRRRCAPGTGQWKERCRRKASRSTLGAAVAKQKAGSFAKVAEGVNGLFQQTVEQSVAAQKKALDYLGEQNKKAHEGAKKQFRISNPVADAFQAGVETLIETQKTVLDIATKPLQHSAA